MAKSTNKANSDYRDFPIEGIISAPLTASAKANSAMAIEQTKFLLEFCFARQSEDTDHYKPVMINLEYTRTFVTSDSNDPTKMVPDKQVSTTIQVPLLTLVPLNNLAIQTVKVDFDLEITRHKATPMDSNKKSSLRSDASNIQLFGYIGSKKNPKRQDTSEGKKENASSEDSEAILSVEISAGPSPLPLGLTSLINAYSKAITPSNTNSNS